MSVLERMSMAATARMDLRISPELKTRIEEAARYLGESSSEFIRRTIETQADRVIAEHRSVTYVSDEFFEEMLALLENPPEPSKSLKAAATRHSERWRSEW